MDNQQERAVDAARLAMLLDTDGWLTMSVRQRDKARVANLQPYAGAVGTIIPLIDWAADAFERVGVPRYVQTIKRSQYVYAKGHKDQKRIVIQGLKRVQTLLTVVMPYLIGKHRQGELLQEFIESRLAKPHKADYSERECEIANEVRSLNSNKGGSWRPISSESIRQNRELRKHLRDKMCSELTRDGESTTETLVPAT